MDKYENRQIRIFISSTFQDMQEERDYLITKVFPRIQAEAAKRDVTIVPVDLRWGVTEEESKSGKVIQICLQEIENSHPFFIGLIGKRYGWCPTKEELRKNEILHERWGEWLEKDLEKGLSITEIEIQYGVLRSNENIDAYFYIKQEKRREGLFGKVFKTDKDKKLERLKWQIRQNKRYPVREFSSAEELGVFIGNAIQDLLDRLYPKQELSALERERIVQQAFIHRKTYVYIPNEVNFRRLDDFLTSTVEKCFVLTGESGMGKSSLLANWIERHKDEQIIYHFTGNGGEQADYRHILNYLCEELKNLIQLPKTSQISQNGLTDTLAELYNLIPEQENILIVLDGIDQLANIDNAKQLTWLPNHTKNVRYLFSTTLGDNTLDILRAKHYPEFVLESLNETERELLVIRYLSMYRKRLLPKQIRRIIKHPICRSPHILQTLLNELISFGSHEQLDQRIDFYLQTNEVTEFFQRVLYRYEEDFGLASKQILSLIAFSYHGLSEQELKDIAKLTPLHWSQFYCAFLAHFSLRNGLFCLAHRQMKEAVEDRYAELKTTTRETIITTFAQQDNGRAWEELAYQYSKTQKLDQLYALISRIDVFDYFYKHDILSMSRYWQMLINANPYSYQLSYYLRNLETPTRSNAIHCRKIGLFIVDYIYGNDGIWGKYLTMAIDHYQAIDKTHGTAEYALDIASCKAKMANHLPSRTHVEANKAYQLFKSAQSIIDSIDQDGLTPEDKWEMADIYYDGGCFHRHTLYLKGAKECLEKAICTGGHHWYRLPDAQRELGIVHMIQHQYDKSLKYLQQAINSHILIYGKKHTKTAVCYEMTAQVLSRLNKKQEAIELATTSVAIYEELLDGKGPMSAEAYDTLGSILKSTKNFEQALKYMEKGFIAYQNVYGEKSIDVIISQKNIGETYMELGQHQLALPYIQKAAKTSILRLEEHNRLAPYNNVHKREMERCAEIHVDLAKIYLALDDEEKAFEVLHKTRSSLFLTASFLLTVFSEIYMMIAKYYAKSNNFWNTSSSEKQPVSKEDAIHLAGEAVAIYERLEWRNKEKYPETIEIKKEYNIIYNQAIDYFLGIIASNEKKYGTYHLQTINSYKAIAAIFCGGHNLSGGQGNEGGEYEKAIIYYKKALLAEDYLLGKDHLDIADTCYRLGGLLTTIQAHEEALAFFNRSALILESHYGPDHKYTERVKNAIKNIQRRL